MSSNTRPDTLVQDRTPSLTIFPLQRTADPYIGSFATDVFRAHDKRGDLLAKRKARRPWRPPGFIVESSRDPKALAVAIMGAGFFAPAPNTIPEVKRRRLKIY